MAMPCGPSWRCRGTAMSHGGNAMSLHGIAMALRWHWGLRWGHHGPFHGTRDGTFMGGTSQGCIRIGLPSVLCFCTLVINSHAPQNSLTTTPLTWYHHIHGCPIVQRLHSHMVVPWNPIVWSHGNATTVALLEMVLPWDT